MNAETFTERKTKLEEFYKQRIKFNIYSCYVHTQFYLALYMCVFILNSFPCGYF